jgi:DNA-binding GntR family transcriptional regulator
MSDGRNTKANAARNGSSPSQKLSEKKVVRDRIASPDRVVEAIIRGIRTGTYAPGQRLIEADLTRELGVSRGPVREAFKRLAAEGALTLTPHRGAYIRALSRSELHDSLVVAEVLLGLMARLAAEQIGKEGNATRMREAFKRLWAFKDKGGAAAFINERHRFYETIAEISNNHAFNRVLPQMQLHLLRMQFQSYITPRDREEQFKDYERISEAILSGDANRAEEVIRAHTSRTRIIQEQLPDDAFPTIQS